MDTDTEILLINKVHAKKQKLPGRETLGTTEIMNT